MTNTIRALKDIREIVLKSSIPVRHQLIQILNITNDALTESAIAELEKCEPVGTISHDFETGVPEIN